MNMFRANERKQAFCWRRTSIYSIYAVPSSLANSLKWETQENTKQHLTALLPCNYEFGYSLKWETQQNTMQHLTALLIMNLAIHWNRKRNKTQCNIPHSITNYEFGSFAVEQGWPSKSDIKWMCEFPIIEVLKEKTNSVPFINWWPDSHVCLTLGWLNPDAWSDVWKE